MDKSLDDIIKERKLSNPSTNKFGRGRGGGRGGFRGGGGRGSAVTSRPNRGRDGGLSTQNRGGRGRGNWKPQQQQQQQQQQKRAPISDARQKLIEKAHQGDARDRLAQKARLTDARLKLTSRRKSGDGQMAQIAMPKGGGGAAPSPVTPVSRTVPNTQFTVRNSSRVQNNTQITIRNSKRDRSPPPRSQQLPQRPAPSPSTPRQANPLLAGASTLRVTKAVPQPQKRPAVDYPHLDDDLIGQRLPNPPKVQRRMPDPPAPPERAWGYTPKMAAPASTGTRLIISNLQITVTEDDIKELFGAIGELQKARMVRPGLAEVMYRSRTDALTAISTYHNRELDGKPMQCKLDTSTIPEAAGHRTAPNALSDRFKTMRAENNPTLPIETFPKGGVPSGIDPGVVTKALFKKSSSSSVQKPVVFTVKI